MLYYAFVAPGSTIQRYMRGPFSFSATARLRSLLHDMGHFLTLSLITSASCFNRDKLSPAMANQPLPSSTLLTSYSYIIWRVCTISSVQIFFCVSYTNAPTQDTTKKSKKSKKSTNNTIQKNHSIAILKKHQHVNVIFSYTILGQHRQEAGTKVP